MKTILYIILLLVCTVSQQFIGSQDFQKYMFTQEITGLLDIGIPKNEVLVSGRVVQQTYQVSMEKVQIQMLPSRYGKTTMYVYSMNTSSGVKQSFPGPAIIAMKGVRTRVIYTNNIQGPPFLPLDFTSPTFMSDSTFMFTVPTIPHLHGGVQPSSVDGLPMAYFNYLGEKGIDYSTDQPCAPNQAIFIYPNQQDAALMWIHDHTYGITRLNVYAGLAMPYILIDHPKDKPSFAQQQIRNHYGQIQQLAFAIADKSFKSNGQLYYPTKSDSSLYQTWMPEFFGNVMTVNGKIWPKVKLQKKVYRMIFLNACQSRFLNIYFENLGQKIPFRLLRLEGDYFSAAILKKDYLLATGARLEIILDLTKINGQAIMKNDAAAPHPSGDPVDKYSGSIMKIQIQKVTKNMLKDLNDYINSFIFPQRLLVQNDPKPLILEQVAVYPQFPEGQKIVTVLTQFDGPDQVLAKITIDGVKMEVGICEGNTLQIGKVYDFHIVNLTPDTHPIHFHLINFQKIYSYEIDYSEYQRNWFALNGGQPTHEGFSSYPRQVDPQLYQSGPRVKAKPHEKVFRDVIDVPPFMVTVIRMKIAHNNGKPFSFNAHNMKFVYHCHILEHEDNEMMRYFCLRSPTP